MSSQKLTGESAGIRAGVQAAGCSFWWSGEQSLLKIEIESPVAATPLTTMRRSNSLRRSKYPAQILMFPEIVTSA